MRNVNRWNPAQKTKTTNNFGDVLTWITTHTATDEAFANGQMFMRCIVFDVGTNRSALPICPSISMNDLSCRERFSVKSRSHPARGSNIGVLLLSSVQLSVFVSNGAQHTCTSMIRPRLACPAYNTKRRHTHSDRRYQHTIEHTTNAVR